MNSLYNICLVCDKLLDRLSFSKKDVFWSFLDLTFHYKKFRFCLCRLHNLQDYEIVRDYLTSLYQRISLILDSATVHDLRFYFSGITGRYCLKKSELIQAIKITYFI